MSTLYNISEDIINIFNNIETSNNEDIPENIYKELEIKKEELNTKLDNYIKAIKEYQKDAEYCKDEKKYINDRQNIYKNRVERLKKAVLDAVLLFGEQGKTNKFIELPTCRIYTKSTTSIKFNEDRIETLTKLFIDYIIKLVKDDLFIPGKDIDYYTILEAINNTAKINYGDNYPLFTINDLLSIKLNITTEVDIESFLLYGNNAIKDVVNPIFTSIKGTINENNLKTINFKTENEDEQFTLGEQIINTSLQIK